MTLDQITRWLVVAPEKELLKLREILCVSDSPKQLEREWINREIKQRAESEKAATAGDASKYGRLSGMADATKQCRLDLQREFKLIKIT